MSAIPTYTEIVELLKKGATLEAQEKIMELREKVIELEEENISFKKEITNLKSLLAFSQQMKHNKSLYYVEGDETPYCPRCWESNKKGIHLIYHVFNKIHYCPECNFNFRQEV